MEWMAATGAVRFSSPRALKKWSFSYHDKNAAN
jgi:hypothetical protein